MRFSASELDIRRPLWIALSDLYLDTVPDWDRIAGHCARSPFSIAELRRILFDEVHPVVHANLWSVAGVWQGFDADWLVASIVARKRRPLFRLPWPEDRRYPWRELKPLIIALRQGDETAG
ncbi:hypothetical protein [Pseudoxanthomonas sp. PXM02]|uniref:DUF7079 family protein n=1 Tax=Pseudoxanthomonas sp. PXM02 TaxID=2769294 RepID=UPI001786446B|nr:hypothetical protein [Pseudoxanthomonas sp. PXM02]MBD9477783.1 hypothetical protein [Pseudoxanthomonas sp. PXM02]